MFKKSKRSFQQRTRHSDSDDDNSAANVEITADNDLLSTSCTKLSAENTIGFDSIYNDDSSNSLKTSNKNERKTKLSFEEDEDDEDVFIVKKSIYSRRMEKNKQKLLKSKDVMKKQSKNLNIEISLNKPESNDQTKLINESNSTTVEKKGEEIIVCPDSEDDEFEQDDEYQKTNMQPHFRTTLGQGIIPDARTIYELKKQRQKLAKTVNEEFIPLDNDENDNNNNAGRLLRESDEDKSDDGDMPNYEDDEEEKDRIQFGDVDYQNKDKEKFKERFLVAQKLQNEELNKINRKNFDDHVDDDDDNDDEYFESGSDRKESDDNKSDESDDEMDKWEREQIRKAVRLPKIYSYDKTDLNNKFLHDDNVSLINKLQVIHDNHAVVPIEVDNQDQLSYGKTIPLYITEPGINIEELNLDTFSDSIQKAKRQIENLIEENKQLLDRVNMDLKLSNKDIESFDNDIVKLTDDYNLYRYMNDFVRNLCDCINDKMTLLEKNEKQALEIFQRYSGNILTKHRLRIQDENSISLYFIMNHKALSIQYASIILNSILDVYNFEGNVEMEKRCKLREENYRKKLTIKQSLNNTDSDDEMDVTEQMNHSNELKDIKIQLNDLFEDTDDDFASVKGIVTEFKKWKTKQLNSYQESFIPDFLPKFLTYYVRYDLVLWNIFDYHSKLNLMDLEAIQSLILYMVSDLNLDQIDIEIIPTLIDNTIIPKLIKMIELDIWNPFSSRETNRLVTFLNSLMANFPTLVDTSKNLPILLQNIIFRIERTVDNDIFIPQIIPSEFFLPNEQRTHYESSVISFVIEFFYRQYLQTLKLMNNAISFRNLIDDKVLKELAMDKICIRYLLTSLSRSAADPIKTLSLIDELINGIPKEWLNPNVYKQINYLLQQLSSNDIDFIQKLNNVKQHLSGR